MATNNVKESHKLKFISERFLKPENVADEARKEVRYLGVKDLFMLSMDPMQKGLLFDTKPYDLRFDFIRKLEKSLYMSLVHFYPLAGRFATQKFYDEHACCFYLDYEKGPGARLIHASVDFTVSDIVSSVDVHPIIDSFFDLGEKSVNHDGHTRPLLSVQVTELHDGVFIGFTMNHCIADGASLWHFISTVSEIFGQIENHEISISRKPIIFNNRNGPIFKLPYLEPDEFIFRYDPSPLRVRLFHFSSKSISVLKAKANEECGLDNHISSFQALCGFIWRSITRSRNLLPDLEVNCLVLINARTRFNPPISPNCVRCFIAGAQAASQVGELLSSGLGRAALLMDQSIKMQDEKTIRESIKRSEENPCVVRPGPQSSHYKAYGVTIGGSSKFDMYEPKFGLGKAVAVLAGYASKSDGKVTANPGRDERGSVDLEICLKPETMKVLELDPEFMRFTSST